MLAPLSREALAFLVVICEVQCLYLTSPALCIIFTHLQPSCTVGVQIETLSSVVPFLFLLIPFYTPFTVNGLSWFISLSVLTSHLPQLLGLTDWAP